MSSNKGDTLGCRLRLSGIKDYKVDEEGNIIYVGDILIPSVVLPYGVHGLKGTGFSGLDIEVIKFNKDLIEFESTSLANCNKLREVHVYQHQLPLISGLGHMYSDLQVIIRKGLL